jgi:RND family efflux transporter MFP subunit
LADNVFTRDESFPPIPALTGMKTATSIDIGIGPAPRRGRILAHSATLAAIAATVVWGCAPTPPRPVPSRAPVAVEVATFGAGAPGADVVLPARVKAAQEVTIASRLGGRLTALRAREGAQLRRGDPIAVFDEPEMRRALAAARAEVASAELSLTVAARQDARTESLFIMGVVAERDRDVALAERRLAEARLESGRSAYEALESGATVRAPFDGVVVRVHVDRGADMPPGAPLADLRSSAGLEVVADVPEHDADRLLVTPLSVQVGDGKWRPARLARLEGMTDWRTRSRTAHLTFDGDAQAGAYALLALGTPSDSAEGGSVPLTSLVSRGALAGVFVIEAGRAHLRWLKLGRERGARVEVLAGLEPGERFALAPRSLADGAPVRVAP